MSHHKKINEKFFQIKGLQFLVKKQNDCNKQKSVFIFQPKSMFKCFQYSMLWKTEREQIKQRRDNLKIITASEREQNHNINHLALS